MAATVAGRVQLSVCGICWPGSGRAVLALLFVFTMAGATAVGQSSTGLSKDQVLKLLQQDPTPRVQFLVNKYGISFTVTPEVEKELTQAGATPDLLETLRKFSPAPAQPAPPPMADLVIHAQPGEAEVYIDDERTGSTSTEGVLKVSNIRAGMHKLRISRQGYHNFELAIDVHAGESNSIVGTLQPVEPTPPEPKPVTTESASAVTAAEKKPPADPNNPLAPHEAGIYFVDATSSHMTKLDAAPYSGLQPSMGRSAAFGGFGGMKWRSVIFGSKAHIRLSDIHPTFYFYFVTPAGNPPSGSYSLDNASIPNQFVLTKMESRKNERDIPGSGAVGTTVPSKALVEFVFEKVANGIYKVQPKADFAPGEYGFLYGGVLSQMGGSGLFDFGVDGKK